MTKNTKACIAIGLVWCVAVAWMVSMLLLFPGTAAPDTQGQYNLMMEGIYRNWKPALYEFQLAVGEKLWPGQGLGLAYVAQILAVGTGFAFTFSHYAKRHVLYAAGIFFLPVFCVNVVLPFYSIINDNMAAGCYVLYIGAILTAADSKRKAVRSTLLLLSLFILFYGFVLRHNSALMMIVLTYWGISKFFPISRLKKLFISMGAIALFCVINTLAIDFLFKCEKSYPLSSPMADDVINISVLRNKWDPVFTQHYDTKGIEPKEISLAAEAGHWNPVIKGTYQDPDFEKRTADFRTLKDVWMETVGKHPCEYVVVKAFLFHQFVLAARSLSCVGDWLLAKYPHVHIAFYDLRLRPSFWLCRQFVALVVIPLIVYGVVAVAGVSVVLRRFKWLGSLSGIEKDALYIGFAGMMYTASFLLLVLSISEFRYYAPRMVLCGMSGCLLGVSAVLRVWRCFRGQRDQPK